MRLLLLFIIVPLLEIWLLIKVGGRIGATLTVVLVILTAVIGVTLLRLQGLRTLTRANERLRAGEVPAQEMGEGLILAVAGLLLLTPGFATDAVGFACLIPPVRRRLLGPWLRGLQARAPSPGPSAGGPGSSKNSGRTLEGDYKRDPSSQERK